MEIEVVVKLLLPLLTGALVALIGIKILLRYKSGLGGEKGSREEIRWSYQQVPTIGGLILFVAFLSGNVFHFYYIGSYNIHLIIGAFFVFAIGLYDDLKGLGVAAKFIGQLAVAIGTSMNGFGFHLIAPVPDMIISVFFWVAIMNSFNMLDNMDGVAGSVVLIFFIGCAVFVNWIGSISLIGGVIVFLIYNMKPAKIYLGDSGSLMLGYIMGFFGIALIDSFLFLSESKFLDILALIFCIFCFPLADTVVVVVNRLVAGISPTRGGRDHSTHHLVYAGVKEKVIPYCYMGVSVLGWLILILAMYLGCMGPVGSCAAWFSFAAFGFFILVTSLLWIISRYNIRNNKFTYTSQ